MANPNLFVFQQPIDYILTVGTSTQVVTTAEAKNFLRIDSSNTSEDSLIDRLIATATNYFERCTGRDLITKTYKCFLDNFPGNFSGYAALTYYGAYCIDQGIIIKKSKFQTITSIEYYVDGVLTTFSSSKYYITEEADEFAGIYLVSGESWPSNVDNRKQAVKITLTSGYGAAASSVPDAIKQAILQYVTYLYENRGDCDCADSRGYPQSAYVFFMQWKIIDL